jgi:hypothetical protein
MKAVLGGQESDILWTTYVPLFVASDRVIALLEGAKITGWGTYPVRLKDRKGRPLQGYVGMTITGREVRRDDSIGVDLEKVTALGIRRVKRGFFFPLETWDGSDMFRDRGYILVTERVKELLVRNKVKNIELVPLAEVDRDLSIPDYPTTPRP